MAIDALMTMLSDALRFDGADIRDFDPTGRALRLLGVIAVPMALLLAVTLAAAVAGPALLGSLGFRGSSMAFKGSRISPLAGIKRIFSMQGVIELAKSIAKVGLIGAAGYVALNSQSGRIMMLGRQDIGSAIASLGAIFLIVLVVMTAALFVVAFIDVPAQMFQRLGRLRMTKQEVKDEHKQTEGSPETKMSQRRRQAEILRGSARQAVAEATVVLVNPTHYAVALRYRPGQDAAPVLVARGRGALAEAIRDHAKEARVPVLSYPSLARAIYFTTRSGDIVREDLYIAVATVLAFVFNIDSLMANGTPPPPVEVPEGARYDEDGRKL